MEPLWDVAPPATWAILALSAFLFLAGFTLLSHTLVRHKAYGDRYAGLLNPGRLEWTLRTGVGCLLVAVALWGLELGWEVWPLATVGVLAAAAFGLELAARLSDGFRPSA